MKAMELIYLPLLVTFVTSIETKAEPCATDVPLPVVNICTPDTKQQDNSDSVLIKANTTQNCTCEISVIDQNKAISVVIQKFDQRKSSSPSDYGCGLILKFGIGTDKNIWEAQCLVNNSGVIKSIQVNNKMTIKSFTVDGTLKKNEGYCIQVKKVVSYELDNQLKLTCGIGSTVITNTTESVKQTTTSTTTTTKTTTVPVTSTVPVTATVPITTTTTVPITTTTVPVTTTTLPKTTITTKTTISTTATDTNELTTYSSTTTNKANQPKHKDNNDTITLTVGASIGGFVTIIVVIVMVCIYRQKRPKTTSKRGPAVNTDTDDYGLRDNVLYVSSEPSDTTKTQNNPEFLFDNDGNYSTVDLDEILPVDDSIDLVKPTMSKSNIHGSTNGKPTIAPKPKQKVAIQDDVYAVPDKKRVKHVTLPGENGCEYAVVSKPSKSNIDKSDDQPSTSNVYAVVAKTKRMSDGKGKSEKR